jgi:hypothetical protein
MAYSWKVHKGEDFKFEGTALFSTTIGAALQPYDLTGATLTWHMGPSVGSVHLTRSSAGATNWAFGTSVGTWTFEGSDVDTEGLAATTWFQDIWLTTSGGAEYCLDVGTFTIMAVVGTL